ncbi:MAG: hypothetical protein ABJ388_17850 [Alphaproteobacteria bacterium]|uniref:hypothetical protein n=1 Tax=Roseibium sp. TaxID=1936156 RepID=UPI0032700D04
MSTPLQNWITDSLNDPELARVMTFDAAKALWRQDLTAPLPASKRTRQGVGSAYLALRLRLRQSAPEIDRIVGRQAHQLQAMLFCLKRPDVARRVAERRHLIEMLDAAGHMVSPEVFMVAPDEVCLIVTNMLFGYREDIPSSAYPVVDRKRAEELAVLAEKARAQWSERVRLLPVLCFLSPAQLEILRREEAFDPALAWTLLKWSSAWARSGLPSRLYDIGCHREVVESMLRIVKVAPAPKERAPLPRFLQRVGDLGLSRRKSERQKPRPPSRTHCSFSILSARRPAGLTNQILGGGSSLLNDLTDEPTARLFEPMHCVIRFALEAFPGFEAWLMREVDEGRGYVLALCFHLAAQALEEGRTGLTVFAPAEIPPLRTYQRHAPGWWAFFENLQAWDREKILSEVAGSVVARGEIRALHKLTADLTGPWPDDTTLGRLFEVIRAANKGKTVRHLESLNRAQVKALLELPDAICRANVVRLIVEGDSSAAESPVRRTLWLTRLSPSADVRRLAGALRHVHTRESLEGVLLAWAEKLRFPPPPFKPATENLLPLDTPKAMIREARLQRNCLAHLIDDVLNGHAYFYRFDDVHGTRWTLRFGPARSAAGGITHWSLDRAEREGSVAATPDEFAAIAAAVRGHMGRRGGSA